MAVFSKQHRQHALLYICEKRLVLHTSHAVVGTAGILAGQPSL